VDGQSDAEFSVIFQEHSQTKTAYNELLVFPNNVNMI